MKKLVKNHLILIFLFTPNIPPMHPDTIIATALVSVLAGRNESDMIRPDIIVINTIQQPIIVPVTNPFPFFGEQRNNELRKTEMHIAMRVIGFTRYIGNNCPLTNTIEMAHKIAVNIIQDSIMPKLKVFTIDFDDFSFILLLLTKQMLISKLLVNVFTFLILAFI